MKIGILTYHDGPNHGAFLQAWSTFRMLADAGHDVEIVNYKNVQHHALESRGGLRQLKNPLFTFRQRSKRRVFRDAQRHFRLSPFTTDPDQVRQRRYDCAVVGSDVVWDYRLFGYDPIYFGRLNAVRRIAFSASFGGVAPDAEHPSEMAQDLAAFDAIAVRDDNSGEVVRRVLGREATRTLDPTLVYDFNGEIPQQRRFRKPYLLVYAYRHPQKAAEEARAYARERGLEIICVGYSPPIRGPVYCSKVDLSVGPFEWVALFDGAEAVMTSTFHGVVFSIKARKPFLFITSRKAHNRVSSLLDTCGIEHGLEFGQEDRVTLFRPDYARVYHRLQPLADASKVWLLAHVSPTWL